MKEARKRNPALRLGALAWGAPGWLGTAAGEHVESCANAKNRSGSAKALRRERR